MYWSRNPYRTKGGPKLILSVVAFIDILGYTELVTESLSSGKGQELLKRFHRALKEARKSVDPRISGGSFRQIRQKDSCGFHAFTGNIVIGHPITQDGEYELGVVFNDLSYFQMIMSMEGFFVRGAISVGDL